MPISSPSFLLSCLVCLLFLGPHLIAYKMDGNVAACKLFAGCHALIASPATEKRFALHLLNYTLLFQSVEGS